MKEIVKQVESFLTFDTPLRIANISTQFSAVHERYLRVIPEWDIRSTRQKLIATYWFSHVLGHFSAIILIASLLLWLKIQTSFLAYWSICLVVALGCFPLLVLTSYLPIFISQFLPRLETVVAESQKIQQEQKGWVLQEKMEKLLKLSEQRLQENIKEQEERLLQGQTDSLKQLGKRLKTKNKSQTDNEKCRQIQFLSPTLILIYYTLAELTGMAPLNTNSQTVALLCRLFGRSKSGIQKHLKFIAGPSALRKSVDDRQLTEIRNRFVEAILFFEEQNLPKGVALLKKLELKILNS